MSSIRARLVCGYPAHEFINIKTVEVERQKYHPDTGVPYKIVEKTETVVAFDKEYPLKGFCIYNAVDVKTKTSLGFYSLGEHDSVKDRIINGVIGVAVSTGDEQYVLLDIPSLEKKLMDTLKANGLFEQVANKPAKMYLVNYFF